MHPKLVKCRCWAINQRTRILGCMQMLRGAADTAPGHTEALVHELLLRSSQDRHLATNSTAALLSSMPLSQAGLLCATVPSCLPGVCGCCYRITYLLTVACVSVMDALSGFLQCLCTVPNYAACTLCILCDWAGKYLMNADSTYMCAGPLNFIFEKAKFTGAVSAQLKEAERQGSSGGCLVRLADELQSVDSCRDINLYNERYSSWSHPSPCAVVRGASQ